MVKSHRCSHIFHQQLKSTKPTATVGCLLDAWPGLFSSQPLQPTRDSMKLKDIWLSANSEAESIFQGIGRQSQQDCRHTNKNITVCSLERQWVRYIVRTFHGHTLLHPTLKGRASLPKGLEKQRQILFWVSWAVISPSLLALNKLTPVRLCLTWTHMFTRKLTT